VFDLICIQTVLHSQFSVLETVGICESTSLVILVWHPYDLITSKEQGRFFKLCLQLLVSRMDCVMFSPPQYWPWAYSDSCPVMQT